MLQLRRLGQQLDDPLKQPSRSAAIEAAMIEAQCQFCLRRRNELLLLVAPRWRLFPGAQSDQQRLIGQRNRRSPIETEGAEIGNGRDSAGSLLSGNSPPPRQLDQVVVTRRQIGERRFVGVANY